MIAGGPISFLRAVAGADPGPTLKAEGVYLRLPAAGDYVAWATLRAESRAFLSPWEPTWPKDDLDKAAFKRRLKRYQREVKDDLGYPFFVFRSGDDALLGGLTLSYVRRGVTQSCALGYWMGEPHAGRGHMTAAVRAVVPFVFQTLRLHRIEAACLPHNKASIRLLEKLGFTREGYARRYLCIDGEWQDHLLFGLCADDPQPTSVASKRIDETVV